ncbi:potassium channel family protein [Cellulomonas soli]|uniref:potassium channel family protein n=1 Tax=Cellulomonas soli TaxID=931535 RepID=UPI003F839C8B
MRDDASTPPRWHPDAPDPTGDVEPPRTVRRRGTVPTDRFVPVLALLVASYVLFMATSSSWAQAAAVALHLATLVLAFQAARGTRVRRPVVAVVLAGAVVLVLANAVLSEADASGAMAGLLAALQATVFLLVVARVVQHPVVTVQTLAGAVSAYLLIGLLFASLYGLAAWASPGALFAQGGNQGVQALQYFSFTTLTTLGYGDLTAASYMVRGLATFEAVLGQIFLATLIARLVAGFRPRRGPAAGEAPEMRHDGR